MSEVVWTLRSSYPALPSHFHIMAHIETVCTAHCRETNGHFWLEVMVLGPPEWALSRCPEGPGASESWQSCASASQLGNCDLNQPSHFTNETSVFTLRPREVK